MPGMGADELERAFTTHRAELAGYARRVLGDPDRAEEVVQETFARAWASRARFDPAAGAPRAWLFAIERNLLADLGRRRARVADESVPVPPEAPLSARGTDDLDRLLSSWQVVEALRRVSPAHRAVLVGVFLEDRPARELAAGLGIPEGTVRSRLYYALRSLRLVLAEMGWGE